MDDRGAEHVVELCNALPRALGLWLEPWAQEFQVPARSTATLRCRAPKGIDAAPVIEASDDDLLTVWGAGGSCIAVHIDGVDQDSFSAGHPAPDCGALSPKQFVGLVFGDHPEARPGGVPVPGQAGLGRWRRWLATLCRS